MTARRRPYWPRYVVVTDSGFNCSHKAPAPAQEHAASMRRAGWNIAVITARSWADADRKAGPIWERFRILREQARAAEEARAAWRAAHPRKEATR